MPAIASLEDLKSAQKDLQEAKNLNELKATFKKCDELDGRMFVNSGLRKEPRKN